MQKLTMASAFFEGWTYRGQSALDVLARRNHKLFKRPNHVLTDPLMTEFEAAAFFSMQADPMLNLPANNWFEHLPRETRAVKAAFYRLKYLGEALGAIDLQDWAEAEAERKAKAKKKKGSK
jgi:hypothetical protein